MVSALSSRLVVLVPSLFRIAKNGGHCTSLLKAGLHGKKSKSGVPTALANRMLLEGLLEGMSIERAPFFEAASHGVYKMKLERGV